MLGVVIKPLGPTKENQSKDSNSIGKDNKSICENFPNYDFSFDFYI